MRIPLRLSGLIAVSLLVSGLESFVRVRGRSENKPARGCFIFFMCPQEWPGLLLGFQWRRPARHRIDRGLLTGGTGYVGASVPAPMVAPAFEAVPLENKIRQVTCRPSVRQAACAYSVIKPPEPGNSVAAQR
jgi:hypothetical protein